MGTVASCETLQQQRQSLAECFLPLDASRAESRTASRRKSGEPRARSLERDAYRFGVADRAALSQAKKLVDRMYAWRGYRAGTITGQPETPNRIALAGSHGERLFATLTLGLDSGDGLLADELYQAEIDAFRRTKRKVCELCAFAVDPQYRSQWVLASLFHLAYVYGRSIHKVTDAVIEINPRHVGFYTRSFHFRQIGEERNCPRVDAPAVLMHLELEHLDTRLAAVT